MVDNLSIQPKSLPTHNNLPNVQTGIQSGIFIMSSYNEIKVRFTLKSLRGLIKLPILS